MENDYTSHYKKYNISPVTQDITDKEKHYSIRSNLYHSLGVPKFFFKNKKVLEIGAGSGYNAIVTASFKPKTYQIVDANPTAIKNIYKLFEENSIDMSSVNIDNCFIEEFQSNEKFDIIICENMLPCVKNNREILGIIDNLLDHDGIIILGCSDEISTFYDLSRRLLANILLERTQIKEFDDILNCFEKAFDSHLKTLKGCNRPTKDWCADNLLGEAFYNTNLAISDVIEFFKDSYMYYNCSPSIIVDETWHKEMPYNLVAFNEQKIEKFQQIWHNLFHYKNIEGIRNKQDNITLRKLCREYFDKMQKHEGEYNTDAKKDILCTLNEILNLLNKEPTNKRISNSITDLISFLEEDDISVNSIANNLKEFTAAFGRGVQYISMVKQ